MIKIAHLYYDLMNLYGENGNIKAICYELKNQGLKYKVDELTIGDVIDFSDYDLFYMGSGTEYNLSIVYDDLSKYKDSIKEAIECDKFFILTGNSFEIFGNKVIDSDTVGLNIFDYTARPVSKRIVSEVIANSKFVKKPILGFQNRGYSVDNTYEHNLFEVIYGNGFEINKCEGFVYKNFFGTYIIGPLLVRNPEFLKYIIKKIVYQKNNKFKYKKFNLNLENDAYDAYLKNYDLINKK